MKPAPYIILFLIFFAASCQKTLIETGVVQGVVKDATTGQPIVNADVFLLQNEIGDGSIIGGPGPSQQIDYTTSATDGSFTFHLDYDKTYRYLCGAEKEFYFDLNQEFNVDAEIKDGVNVEVLLNPVAWINVHLKAVNEYEADDFISISNIYETFYGSDIDTILSISAQGNILNKIVWFIYIDGINEGSESTEIYCPAFDTTYYELFY